MSDKTIKLLPCPFCGYEKPMNAFEVGSAPPPTAVYCPSCGTDGPQKGTAKEADKAWNMRVNQ